MLIYVRNKVIVNVILTNGGINLQLGSNFVREMRKALVLMSYLQKLK